MRDMGRLPERIAGTMEMKVRVTGWEKQAKEDQNCCERNMRLLQQFFR